MSFTIKQDDISYPLRVEKELSGGAQGTTYTGSLDKKPVVIKQLNTPLSAIAQSQLNQQLQIEVLLERSFGACGNPGSRFTCFKGIVANDAFLASLPIEPKFKFSREKPDILLLYSFVNGEELYNWIAAGTLTLDLKISIIRQLLTIVSQMKGAGIIHRDIKPENLMYDGASLKIIDFGLACTTDTWKEGDTPGSAGFVGPEVILNSVTKDTLAASDIFAAGMTIIQIVTGRSHLEMTAERFGEEYTDERAAMLKYMTRPRYYGGKVLDLVSIQFGDMALETCDLFFGMIHPTPEKRLTAEYVLAEFNKIYPPGAPAAAGGAGGAAAENPYATPVKAYKAELEAPERLPQRSPKRSPREENIAPPPAELAALPEVELEPLGIEAMSPIAKREELRKLTPLGLGGAAGAAAASPMGGKKLTFGGRRRQKKTRRNRKNRTRTRRS